MDFSWKNPWINKPHNGTAAAPLGNENRAVFMVNTTNTLTANWTINGAEKEPG